MVAHRSRVGWTTTPEQVPILTCRGSAEGEGRPACLHQAADGQAQSFASVRFWET